MHNFTECSVSLWLKILSWNTSYATYFQFGLGSTPWAHYIFGLLRNNTASTLCFTISNGSSATNANCLTPVLSLNTWYHLTLTYSSGHCKIYVNGTETKDYATSIIPNFSGITTGTIGIANNLSGYQTNCLINDFRIYDHALSAAEVKEISQGLVLHYKLDDTYAETSIFLTSTITTTAYNSQGGKYGYNTDSNLAKTEGVFQGKQCIKISTITEGKSAQPYSYFSNLYTSNGTNSPAYKALSFDYYTTCPTTTWLNIYKLGSGTGTATWKTISATAGTRTGTYTNSSNSILVQPNEWNRVEVVFHGTADADAQWGYCINGPAHTSNANYYFLFANIQLEQNDHVTGQGQGLHQAIITDSSGYNHNGTIIGSPTIKTSINRYSNYINFADNTAHIECGIINTSGFGNSYTFAWWGTKSSSGTMFWGFQDGIRLNGMYNNTLWNTGDGSNNPIYKIGTTTTITPPDVTTWHHYVMTGNGTKCYLYVDGQLYGEAKTYKSISGTKLWINGWQNATNYAGNINMSDFRVYCTALDAEAIDQLYRLGAKIDNKQNLHTFEINENGSNKLLRTGVFKNYAAEPYIKLADGSYWKLMLFHYVDGGDNLFTQANAAYNNGFGLYSRLRDINNYTYGGKYEFYVIQDGIEYRWTQTSQPTASSIAGKTVVSGYADPVNGLAKASQSYTYIGYGSWWGACGSWTKYSTGGKTGIPGFGAHSAAGICTEYLALYARIEEPKAQINNECLYAENFIEA